MVKHFLNILLMLTPIVVSAQVCQGNFGSNIFESGNFGFGTVQVIPFDPGIAPGYTYTNALPPNDGFYSIANKLNAGQIFPDWLPINDNSGTEAGYMMVVNASVAPGLFYEQTITGLCDNVIYEFSADIFNLIASFSTDRIDPNVSFLLNDQVVFNTGSIPKNERWNTYGFTFTTAPGQETLKLSLRNNAPGGIGNDLALDNITFRPCGATAKILPETVANICEDGQPIDILATVEGANFEDIFVQWQQSFDGGSTWLNLEDETNSSYAFTNLEAGDYFYRYLLADTKEKLGNPRCRTISNVKIVRVIPKFVNVTDSVCIGLSGVIGEQEFFEAGTYIDTLTNIIGCDSIVTLDLSVIEEELKGVFAIKDPSCTDENDGNIKVESFSNQGPYQIMVNGQSFSGPGNQFNLTAGNYFYQVTDRYGCLLDTLIRVNEPPPFTIDLGTDQNLTLGETLSVAVTASDSVTSYSWLPNTIECQPPCESFSLLLPESQTVSVTAISVNGCIATDELLVSIDGTLELFTPNVFTPNGDGVNDYFTIFNKSAFNAIQNITELHIFDRTGREMFRKQNFPVGLETAGWDGSKSGAEAPSGVYFYAAVLTLINEEQITISGNLSLFR
ncbi:MAG: gliding motility-associated C-terminal domain-containing protein [Bacteroidota bacterium]